MTSPPNELCILRMSALGDICHALPVIRRLQRAWPACRFTWIIGKLEAELIGDIPEIDFIIFDKAKGLAAYGELRNKLKGKRFDLLLMLQDSLRSSLVSLMIKAEKKLGFDAATARDKQTWFSNQQIKPAGRVHAIDAMLGFADALDIEKSLVEWSIPIPTEAREFALQQLDSKKRTLLINPCASASKRIFRNWLPERYAAVADYAMEQHNMQVVLCGGPSEQEQQYGKLIADTMQGECTNLIGQTKLKQLLALLAQADIVLTPDSGPAHMATAMGTPVLGLYAATNPQQTGPYLSLDDCISHYEEAIKEEYGQSSEKLAWGVRAHGEAVMEKISVQEVCRKLDEMAAKF